MSNNPAVQPTLAALLNLKMQETMLAINCMAIGTIESFDPTTQSAKISLNYKRLTRSGDNEFQATEYPPLQDVPCVVMGGGEANLTFPIAAGDGCLVFFCDRDIDAWLYTGKVVPPDTARLHAFSDAIALVGIRAFPNALTGYDAANPTLDGGSALLSLKNEVTDLKTLVNGLIDLIKGLTTTNAVVGAPCAISVASQALLTTYKTTVGGLLK